MQKLSELSTEDQLARIAKRFWTKVNKNGPIAAHMPHLGRCWVWTAGKSSGYGRIGIGDKRVWYAHQISWMLKHGVFSMLWVLHHCDNRACVRPEHLFEGTVVDNTRDMDAKGRRVNAQPSGDRHGSHLHPESVPRGESHYKTQLTDDLVREIRARAARGDRQVDIAKDMSLERHHVGFIVRRTSWRHIK